MIAPEPPSPTVSWPMLLLSVSYAQLGLDVASHLFPGRPLFTLNEAGQPTSSLTPMEAWAVEQQRAHLVLDAWHYLTSPELAAYLTRNLAARPARDASASTADAPSAAEPEPPTSGGYL